jgi:hypothetical protein
VQINTFTIALITHILLLDHQPRPIATVTLDTTAAWAMQLDTPLVLFAM